MKNVFRYSFYLLMLLALCFAQVNATPKKDQKKNQKKGRLQKFEQKVREVKENHTNSSEDQESGRLDEFEQQVSEESYDSYGDSHPNDSDDYGESLISVELDMDFFGNLSMLPYHTFIYHPEEDTMYYHSQFWHCNFSEYPYYEPEKGLISHSAGKQYSINFRGHYYYTDPSLDGMSLQARMSPSTFMSIEFHFTDLVEQLGTHEDYLRFYDIFLNYCRIRDERFVLWWGLGMKGMEGNDTYRGFAFNVTSEMYPGRPASIYVNYNVGNLNAHLVSELLLTLNFHIKRIYLYIGYQRVAVEKVSLNGFTSGLGIHL